MHAKRTAYEYVVAKNTLKAKFVRADALGGEGPAANGTRVLHDVHGIQLLFSQEGELWIFDFPTLALSLLTGLAMLSLAKTLADVYLFYLAPKRDDYRIFARSDTPRFDPRSEDEVAVRVRVRVRVRVNRKKTVRKKNWLDQKTASTHAKTSLT